MFTANTFLSLVIFSVTAAVVSFLFTAIIAKYHTPDRDDITVITTCLVSGIVFTGAALVSFAKYISF